MPVCLISPGKVQEMMRPRRACQILSGRPGGFGKGLASMPKAVLAIEVPEGDAEHPPPRSRHSVFSTARPTRYDPVSPSVACRDRSERRRAVITKSEVTHAGGPEPIPPWAWRGPARQGTRGRVLSPQSDRPGSRDVQEPRRRPWLRAIARGRRSCARVRASRSAITACGARRAGPVREGNEAAGALPG